MSEFNPPLADIAFVLDEHVLIRDFARLPGFEEVTPDLVAAVLGGAAQLTAQVIAPLNRSGDREGARIEDGRVVEAAGFRDAYRQYIEGGWNSLPFPTRHGGQGLPQALATAVQEMVQSANLAFSLCPLLTQGAIDALMQHADAELQRTYLPKMIVGEWAGTMNLTEPQAGSDLAAVRARAEREGGHYRISGTKIFITWGDHGMTDNVIHLVLARLPDAPAGVKGISLFLVPKFLVNADGSLGERNDVRPVSVEHKLGIHASPTCVMSFGDGGGAMGFLVGRENEGLVCMFTMMNHARLTVGLQGVAVAERARQQAVAYARERVQGTAPGSAARVTIVHHPDVRRMLLQMRALTEAGRALVHVAMAGQDHIHRGGDAQAQVRLALLTPIVKGWCTEMAVEVASLGVQVHGGMGFIEEAGAAQHLRDARILPIYEGTNGIQALDLVGRKFLRDGGAGLHSLIAEMHDVAATLDNGPLADVGARLAQAIVALQDTAGWIAANADRDGVLVGSVAYHFLMLAGTVAGGWQLAVAARAAARRLAVSDVDETFCTAKLVTARFYAEQILPRAHMHAEVVRAGAEAVMSLDEALLA
jgi:alkylation response protein AidB-like acyl-CoA dehydrogenase